MSGFFSKLFGRTKRTDTPEAPGTATTAASEASAIESVPARRGTGGRREAPKELDWSNAEYVPLPPSPPTWEVDGRDESQREYDDPVLGPVFKAGFQSKHTKVVKLAAGLSPEQRRGRVGDTIAGAFRKLVIKRMKAGQLAAAARQCLEMFELVPAHVEEVDKRRFNRILSKLDKAGKKHSFEPVAAASASSEPRFAVANDSGWVLEGERKLKGDERPDSAFDLLALDACGMWLIDRSGRSANEPGVQAVLRRVDRHGRLVAERALSHDAYRTGNGAGGDAIAIMDSRGGLHIYDAALDVVLESNLRDDPRVVDHFRTVDTNYWGELRSQVRAVDVAPERDRYLFTLADEAWCCTPAGRAAWGVVMPLKDGWKRVVGRSERYGVGREVDKALRLLGVSLPVSPAEIKRKYRALALAHHPDRNPDDPHAAKKMMELNLAVEVLTGVDPNTLRFEATDMTYFARTRPDHVVETAGLRLEISISGGTPQDWVYAASFAASGGRSYIATYSGKVILLSREGRPCVVYDLGTCPTDIKEAGGNAYFLTPTRLYVVEDRSKLAAFLDVFRQGQLVVTSTGFGLLTSKKLQWFTAAGAKLGELTTHDPIRTLKATDGGTIVQTRQHEVEVRGLVI